MNNKKNIINTIKKVNELRERRKSRSSYKLKTNRSNYNKLRLVINRTQKHMHVQLVDDVSHKSIFGFSTVQPKWNSLYSTENLKTYNVEGASRAGQLCGKELKEFLINTKEDRPFFIDIRSLPFIGRIRAFVENLRVETNGGDMKKLSNILHTKK